MRTRPEDYTVGWICAVETEYVVAWEFLDDEFTKDQSPQVDLSRDHNIYTFGRIHGHYVVISCLPDGRYGHTSATLVAERMRSSFPALRFGLMVGIAGGAPSCRRDIRLGDVVVSSPTPRHGGVIQYDVGKAIQEREFEETRHLAAPPEIILSALRTIKTLHKRNGHQILKTIDAWLGKRPHLSEEYGRPCGKTDRLYISSYVHSKEEACNCMEEDPTPDTAKLTHKRGERKGSLNNVEVHYGLIASANKLMKDAVARDIIIRKHNVLCFEMEAAGLMNNFPCVVIRGICDYSDTHKNDRWQGYAAAVAAAYAKELLEVIPTGEVKDLQSIEGRLSPGTIQQLSNISRSQQSEVEQADTAIRQYYPLSERLRIERLSGQTLSLEQCYINLALKDLSEKVANTDGEMGGLSLKKRLRLEARDAGHRIALNRIYDPRRLSNGTFVKPRRIFIQGRAGVGKTTLCKKIVHEFLEGRFGHELFDRLLWFPMRCGVSREIKYGWLEFIQDAFTPAPQHPDWDALAERFAKELPRPEFQERTLFLFDGLDEFSQRKRDKMFEFLQSVICDMPNVILTSRPQGNSLKIGQFDLEMETIGFTLDQIVTYVGNCIQDTKTRARIQEAILTKPTLKGLLRIPIQLDAFCSAWSSGFQDLDIWDASAKDKLQISTMTTLYSYISIELCRKDLLRIGRCDQPQVLQPDDVLQLLDLELRFLEEVAFQGFINGIFEFNPRHQALIHRHFKQSGNSLPPAYGSTLGQLSFLRSSGEGISQSKSYHFLHLTYQEYFAASYFVRHWRTETSLVYLNINSVNNETQKTMSPTGCLQVEKYNPRFNIFWRFVTGLLQIQPITRKYKTVVDFLSCFQQEPRDLLGPMHHRQLMYCLSELLPSQETEIVDLRSKLENCILHYTIAEYRGNCFVDIATEVDYPERLLCSFLQPDSCIPLEVVLLAMLHRPSLGVEVLQILLNLADGEIPNESKTTIMQITFKNSRFDTQLLVERATDKWSAWLNDTNVDVRAFAIQQLVSVNVLPQALLDALLAILEDKNEDIYLRVHASNVLSYRSLSVEANTSLITLFEDVSEDEVLRKVALSSLEMQNLSTENIEHLVSRFEAEDASAKERKNALRALRRSHLPTKFLAEMTAILSNNNVDDSLKEFASDVLSDRVLSPELTEALTSLLYDQNSGNNAQGYGLRALAFQYDLPQKAIAVMVKILKNKGKQENMRGMAAVALGNQSSLRPEILASLVVVAQDSREGLSLRAATIAALRGQRCSSKEVNDVLLSALEDCSGRLLSNAACVFHGRLCLLDEVTRALIHALTSTEGHVRESFVGLLADQPLSQESIQMLIANVKDDRSSELDVLLGQELFHNIIKDLDIHCWRNLWSYLRRQCRCKELSCYEVEGSLILRSSGRSWTICSDSERTKQLLQAVSIQKPEETDISYTEESLESSSHQDNSGAGSQEDNLSFSRQRKRHKPTSNSMASPLVRTKKKRRGKT